jgi:hypothetical protein
MIRYNLVFYGQISPGYRLSEVKRRLAALYRVDTGKIARLFCGHPVVIKRGLDFANARRDMEIFENTGACCRMLPADTPAGGLPSDRPAAGNTEPAAAGSLFQPPRRPQGRRRFGIPTAVFRSFYSRALYRDAALHWRTHAFVYLLLLVGVLTVASTVRMHYRIEAYVRSSARRFVRQIPDITITDGRIAIDHDQPYIIHDPDSGEPAVIIDTTGQFTSLENTGAVALLTHDRLIVKNSARETRILDLSGIQAFHLDQPTIHRWLEAIRSWLALCLFPFILTGRFVFRALQVVVYGLIGLLIGRTLKADLPFQAATGMAVMALTPALLIDQILSLLDTPLPAWTLISFLITLGYLYFGLKAATASPTTR